MENISKKLPSICALGKYTFWGVFHAHRDLIAQERGWNSETLKGYESAILNKIVPHLTNHDHRSLSALSRDDFKAALDAIRKEGYLGENGTVYRYDQETLDRFWYLMEVVTETTEMKYLCRNVLSKSPTIATKGQNSSSTAGKVVPRYMPPDLEQRAGDLLLEDPMQDGARLGLAGMLCWGGRNAEAAGLNFGDVRLWRDIPGCWVAWVYKTTIIDSNKLQSSGKTRNADRVVLLPDRYVQLVLERKRRLQKVLGPEVDIDALPIACKGEDYFTRCSTDDLTSAAKQLFAQLKIPPEHIELAYEDIQREISLETDPLNRLNLSLIEKEPTAYFLRRIYGTALACIGLTEQDVAFQIGHDLGTVPEYRNELLNTSKLLEIKHKLDMRPVVNTLYDRTISAALSGNCAVSIPAGNKIEYRIPAGTGRVELHLSACEPQDEIRVAIQANKSGCAKVYVTTYSVELDGYRPSLDVMADYHRLYKTNKE